MASTEISKAAFSCRQAGWVSCSRSRGYCPGCRWKTICVWCYPLDVPAPDIVALLNEVLLPPIPNLLPSALSLGMARRVALARALVVDPAILVLDEPFASLDQSLATTLGMRIVDRVRRRGTLVLLSTHDIDQALAMSTRVLVIAGEPASLVEDILVPRRDDDNMASAGLRQSLLSRFSFLGRGGS